MSSDLNSPTPPPAEEEEPQDMGAEEEEEAEEEAPAEPGPNSLGLEPLLLAPYGKGEEEEDEEPHFETREQSDAVKAAVAAMGLS